MIVGTYTCSEDPDFGALSMAKFKHGTSHEEQVLAMVEKLGAEAEIPPLKDFAPPGEFKNHTWFKTPAEVKRALDLDVEGFRVSQGWRVFDDGRTFLVVSLDEEEDLADGPASGAKRARTGEKKEAVEASADAADGPAASEKKE
jgi:hypothetical protein